MADPNTCKNAIYSEDVEDYIAEYFSNIEDVERQYNAICSQEIPGKFLMLYRTLQRPFSTSVVGDFYRNIPKLYGLMDISNLEDMGIYKLRRLPYLDLYGSGTLIGIIDTGIDYTNPLFINTDNTSRIAAMWDQTIETGPAPTGVYYGTEYQKEDFNRALASETPLDVVPTVDSDGHGTFVSGIAAGNIDEQNDFSGIAPQAELLVVKLKPAKTYLREFFGVSADAVAYQENDVMLAVEYLQQKALQLNRPISICISIGTSSGDHEGASLMSAYINSISNTPGLCISAAAGNEGNAGHHYSGNVPYGESEDVELKISDKTKALTLEMWSVTPSLFSVAIISPSGEIQEKIPARQDNTTRLTFVLEPTTVEVTYAITDTVTGNELIFMQFTNLTPGIWRIRVYNENTIGTEYHMWLPVSTFVDADTYFLQPDPYITLVETGTTARSIVVSTYDHKGNSIYIASSRGYTLNNQIKPDITAPGVNIYGPVSRNAFGERSGSSIAAAHAAGAAALFLQWGIVEKKRQTMNTSEIKALFIKGADRSSREYPNKEWGYGILNAFNAFESVRKTV